MQNPKDAPSIFNVNYSGNSMNALEFFSLAKDIALAVAACTTAFVAYTGLGKWQKELSGKANFDVARDLAKSVYALRDEISYCRSPFISAYEFPEGFPDSIGKRSSAEEGQAYAHVYSKRWEPVGKALQAFDTAALAAEALWERDIREKTNELRKCVRSLQVDIQAFISNKYSGGEHFNSNRDFAKTVEEGIWEMKAEKNDLTQRINQAIVSIEGVIRPHLSRS